MERGIRRVELEVVSKTGLMQVGVIGEVYQVLIFVYSDTLRSISASDKAYQDVWNDENAVDVWYMMSNGDLYSGGTRLFKTGKQIRTGDVIGLEIDMTYGRTVVRKVAATSKGDHVFGGPCKVAADSPVLLSPLIAPPLPSTPPCSFARSLARSFSLCNSAEPCTKQREPMMRSLHTRRLTTQTSLCLSRHLSPYVPFPNSHSSSPLPPPHIRRLAPALRRVWRSVESGTRARGRTATSDSSQTS